MYCADETRYDHTPIRRVGESGLQLPAVALGLWRHYSSDDPLAARREVILKAFDSGVFHFDVANHYGDNEFGSSESLLGQVLSDELKPYRDELVIATKIGFEIHKGPFGIGTSRKAMMQGIDSSLRRLQLDYVDILYAHLFDDKTDLNETVRALDDIVRSGKALYVGVSNYDNEQTKRAIAAFQKLGTPFVLNQESYNMFNRGVETSGLLDTLEQAGTAAVAYGPLAEGLLSDRYLNGIPEDFPIHRTTAHIFNGGKQHVVDKLNKLNRIALDRGQTLSQMALAWLLRQKTVASVVIGTTSVEHLQDNLKATENLSFSKNELDEIDKILAD